MARTEIGVQSLNRSGTVLSTGTTDSVNGNFFLWSGGPILLSFYTTTTTTVTIKTTMKVDQVLQVPNMTLVIPPFNVFLWSLSDPSPYLGPGAIIELDSTSNQSIAIYKVM